MKLTPIFRRPAILGLALRFLAFTLMFVGAVPGMLHAQEQAGEQNFAVLDSADLAAMLEKKDFLLVNVHVPYEGEIANTDLFIPYDKIAGNLDRLPRDKSAKIVLYCRSGRMSEIAARAIAQLGYTRVSHLAGGMNDWKQSGYQIIEK